MSATWGHKVVLCLAIGVLTHLVADGVDAAPDTVVKDGVEFVVNERTFGIQDFPTASILASREALVTWSGPISSLNLEAPIWARRVGQNGPIGADFQISTTVGISDNRSPEIAGTPSSGFMIVWENQYLVDGSDEGIFGRRLDALGVAVGSEFRVNTETLFTQATPAVSANAEGEIVVVWHDRGDRDGDEPKSDLRGQRYGSDAVAVGTEFVIATGASAFAHDPRVASFATKGFVVTWSMLDVADDTDVFARLYDEDGNVEDVSFQVNTFTADGQRLADVATCGDAGFIVVWQSLFQDADTSGIFAQRYLRNGQKVGGEIQLNQYVPSEQTAPVVATIRGCDVVTVWQSYGQDGDEEGLFGRVVTGDGATSSDEFQINTYTSSSQGVIVDRGVSIARASDSSFLVVWVGQDGDNEDDLGVVGQWFCIESDATALCGDTTCRGNAQSIDNGGGRITTTDPLHLLRGSIGLEICRACVCDTNNSGGVTATDALMVLRSLTGQTTTLVCPSCS